MPEKPTTPSFLSAYQDGLLGNFFPLEPNGVKGALALPRTSPRQDLAKALTRHAKTLDAPQAVFEALENLKHPESRAVVTGQQVGFLLGPNYSLSKAVSAINLAKQLSTEDKPVVPIFWLASQDHDSEEINHSYLLDLDEKLTRLELPFANGVPAGRIKMEQAWLENISAEISGLAANEVYKQEVLTLIRDTASHANNIADWFAAMLYKLLGEHGLIIINPLEPDIAPLFSEVIKQELCFPFRSSDAINQAANNLKDIGLAAQLGRANGASNVFLEEHHEGVIQRQLLRFDDEGFYTESARYSRDELFNILEDDASRLTPAAGLRPITQDAILPTAVMVVGPGELAYFSQIKGVYEQHKVAMPLIYPRMTVTILEPPVKRILEKYQLRASELMQDFETVKERLLLELNNHADVFNSSLSEIDKLTNDLIKHIREIDPTLERTVNVSRGYFETNITRLKQKSAKAIAKQDDITTSQLKRLETHLLPLGTPQERLISPFSFFLKFGMNNVITAMMSLPSEGDHELSF